MRNNFLTDPTHTFPFLFETLFLSSFGVIFRLFLYLAMPHPWEEDFDAAAGKGLSRLFAEFVIAQGGWGCGVCAADLVMQWAGEKGLAIHVGDEMHHALTDAIAQRVEEASDEDEPDMVETEGAEEEEEHNNTVVTAATTVSEEHPDMIALRSDLAHALHDRDIQKGKLASLRKEFESFKSDTLLAHRYQDKAVHQLEIENTLLKEKLRRYGDGVREPPSTPVSPNRNQLGLLSHSPAGTPRMGGGGGLYAGALVGGAGGGGGGGGGGATPRKMDVGAKKRTKSPPRRTRSPERRGFSVLSPRFSPPSKGLVGDTPPAMGMYL